MTYVPIIIRTERPTDQADINDMIRSGLQDMRFVRFCEALRQGPFNPLMSLVADRGGTVMGYALHFEVMVETASGSYRAIHLAPVAVAPRFREEGVAERLVRHGMQRASSLGFEVFLALGAYADFHRFGFLSARVQGFHTDLPLPEQSFVVRRLDDQDIGNKKGKVVYPAALLQAGF